MVVVAAVEAWLQQETLLSQPTEQTRAAAVAATSSQQARSRATIRGQKRAAAVTTQVG